MKTRKRIAAILLAAVMVISGMPLMVFAVDDGTPGFNVEGSKKADPTKLKADRKTTVTLEMPSGEYQNEIDIVFAMDSSTSSKNSAVFTESVESLFNSILSNNENLKLKVGVVRFRGRAHDAIKYVSNDSYSELTEYNDTTKQYIEHALSMTEDEVKAAFGNGSNTHGGIDIANEWLKADSGLDDSHKYIVLLTDGKTYIWNDENHEPTTIYSQYYKWTSGKGPGVIQSSGNPTVAQVAGYNKYDYSVDVLDPSGKSNICVFGKKPWDIDDYKELYNSNNPELTGAVWDAPCYYADNKTDLPSGTIKQTVTNGATLFGSDSATYGNKQDYQYYWEFTPSGKWEGIKYLEANPFKVIKNDDGTYTFDTDSINPNYYQYHVDCLQKGMYKAGHLWTEVNEKYNCASIIYTGGSSGGGLELRAPFLSWLKENSDYGADISNSSQVEALFEDIDNSIRYMVGSGVVTDEITDDFDLDESSATPFSMTYDGSPLSVASAGENKWNFGSDNGGGVFPYVVEYDKSTKTITWTINVPVENLKKITLSYDLILKEDRAPGTYDTNKSAILVYNSSDGKYQGRKYEFEVPKVVYSKPAPTPASYTLTINYVYSTGGTAAPTYTASLKAGTSYGPINSPTIKGYKADRTSISGVMPEGNATYTVVYTPTGGDKPNNPGGGGGLVVTPGDGQTTPPTIPDEPTPTTEPPATDIVDPEPPLAAGAWALINLICAILTALGAIIALFRRKEEEDEDEDEAQNAYKAEDEEEEDDNRGKKMLAAKTAGVLAGVAAPITFFLTEDMSLPMQLTDKWTLLMVVILAVQIVAAVFNKKASELEDDEEETAEEAAN